MASTGLFSRTPHRVQSPIGGPCFVPSPARPRGERGPENVHQSTTAPHAAGDSTRRWSDLMVVDPSRLSLERHLQSRHSFLNFLGIPMTVDLEFTHDTEFQKLLARRSDIDLMQVALELARDAQPNLDFGHTCEWIERRAGEVRSQLSRAKNDREMLTELSRCLAGTHGLHGDKSAFQHAESSYLNRVIETGVGIPISLSLVYVAVAQRAGLELAGVAAPMHFLTRLDTIEGPLFLDAYHHGHVLEFDDCCAWLETLSGLSGDEIDVALEPAEPRAIILRMLHNLKAVHVQGEQWQHAWHVQRRLTALDPGVADQRRDLAIIALKSNRAGVAIDLLEGCLKTCSNRDRAMLQSHLRVAERLLATLN